jgi:hypothetical protein
MKRALTLKVLAAAILMAGASMAAAQTGPVSQPLPQPQPTPGNVAVLAGTQWTGMETLANFGKLTFQFGTGQDVLMIDAQAQTKGNYSQNGNQVRITFSNCIYSGMINGNVLSGTAQYTQGATAGQPWTFNVQYQAQGQQPAPSTGGVPATPAGGISGAATGPIGG